MDYFEGYFRVDTFGKTTTTSVASQYLKYTWDVYRVHSLKNPRYEHPLMLPDGKWKALIVDAKEKKLSKEGKISTGTPR